MTDANPPAGAHHPPAGSHFPAGSPPPAGGVGGRKKRRRAIRPSDSPGYDRGADDPAALRRLLPETSAGSGFDEQFWLQQRPPHWGRYSNS